MDVFRSYIAADGNLRTAMIYSILYRGRLASCNYGCTYCPFAKKKDSKGELIEDQQNLERFVSWVKDHPQHQFNILFTPWGEALIRKHYQDAIVTLSHLANVGKVAIQTNLSCRTNWLKRVNKSTTALWTTYHPTEVSREAFLRKCKELDDLQIRYSVGMVGFKHIIEEIELVRTALPPSVYLWINAYKREQEYYSSADVEALSKIDHLFEYNTRNYESEGRSCRTGQTVFSLDGHGNMYRCHFIKDRIGNIYEQNFESSLFARVCANKTCGCHIGYVHMPDLKFDEVFKGGELERIPLSFRTQSPSDQL